MTDTTISDEGTEAFPAVRRTAAYDGTPGTTAAARDFAAAFLDHAQGVLGVPVTEELLGSVKLTVSELMTNASKYAPGPCLLEIGLDEGQLVITVWDSGSELPMPRSPDPERIGRHGLEIVLSLCGSFEVAHHGEGKRIRVSIPLE